MRWLWLTSLLAGTSSAQVLKVGDRIPSDLGALADDGQFLNLTAYTGRWLVLYFYPHDDTPGCTKQSIEFSRLLDAYHASQAEVLGVSLQGIESHQRFRKKHNLRVRLLADEQGALAKAFGIKTFAGMCSRDVVVVDPQGRVALIRSGVSPENSPTEILNWIKVQNQKAAPAR